MKFSKILIFLFAFSAVYSVPVELKNVLTIEGFQENPLLGYGIVVGLKGTGDSDNGSHARQILSLVAKNFGFRISPEKLKAKNSAVVLVTATLTPFSRAGSKIDVRVSSIYDAKSLEGGELIITPLLGGDNEIYAIAKGNLLIDKNTKGVSGIIPQGAIVQKEIDQKVVNEKGEVVFLVSENVGLSSCLKIVQEIKKNFGDYFLSAEGNKIVLKVTEGSDILDFISKILALKVDIEDEPSVIIDVASGAIVSGGNVVISEAAVSYKNIQLNIGSSTQSFFSSGLAGKSEQKAFSYIRNTATVSELVDSLNQLGLSGRDIAKILELLYKNGNLKARLIIQ